MMARKQSAEGERRPLCVHAVTGAGSAIAETVLDDQVRREASSECSQVSFSWHAPSATAE